MRTYPNSIAVQLAERQLLRIYSSPLVLLTLTNGVISYTNPVILSPWRYPETV
jgi:hypothetical protein